MLITPAKPCGGGAGSSLSRQIFGRRKMYKRGEVSLTTHSHERYKLYTFTPAVVAATARASKAFRCGGRRRVRDDVGGGEEDDSYGYNEEIAMVEKYSESCREEALIVRAIVDEEEVEVVIFKGVSSCLSGETAVDPARSVLPERAVIKTIDRVKGPFNPLEIHYIEKGLSFEAFKKTIILK